MKNNYFLLVALFVSQIILASNPIIPSLQPLHYCDPNNDGFGTFDLDSQNAFILSAQSGDSSNYTITYHETEDGANDGSLQIDNPSIYNNIQIYTQTIYVRIKNINTNEFALGSFAIVVDPSPEITIATDYQLCDANFPVGFESFDLTTKIPELLGSLNPSFNTVTFYNTLSDAQAGTNMIVPVNNYVNSVNPQIIYARVTNIATGCNDVAPFNLIVNPLPNSTQPAYPPYTVCDINQNSIGYETFDLGSLVNSILLGQTEMTVTFFPSLGDAQNGTQTITNLMYVNQIQYVQTLGIRITNNVTGCYVISTMDIRVEPLPVLYVPIDPIDICDDNQDGFSNFNLASLVPDLLSGAFYNVTFYETLTDAQIGFNAINISVPYQNTNPFYQVIWVRGEDPMTHCYRIYTIYLDVFPSPIVGGITDISVCDTDSNPQNGSTSVDLTVVKTDLLALQTLPANNYSVTFFTSQASADLGTSPVINPTNYPASNGDIIWVRIQNNGTGCFAVTHFGITINTPLALTTPTPLNVCDDDANPNDQYHVFNLTVKDTEIAQGTGYAVTYYPTLVNAQTGTNVIANPTAFTNIIPAVQTIGVVVTSPNGCKSITTLDIRVLPIPNPNTNPPALTPQCDVNDSGDMLEIFDLTVNAAYIINGDPNLTLHYFLDLPDAIASSNEILTPTAALVGSNVWIKVENTRINFQGNHCYILVEQPLRVYPVPSTEIISDDTSNAVYVDGSNTVVRPLLLDSQLSGNYSYQWYADTVLIPNATHSTFLVSTSTLNGNSRTYTVSVTNLDTQCNSVSEGLVVLQSAAIPPPQGPIIQDFAPGATLANINVSGSNIQWYASATNKNEMMPASLPLNTVLVNDTTYYATQTIGALESASRLPVKVYLLLGVPTNEILSLNFSPNPVRNVLTLKSDVLLKSVLVCNLLGQKVYDQSFNENQAQVDLTNLRSGTYILKAQGETAQKTIKIVKQ